MLADEALRRSVHCMGFSLYNYSENYDFRNSYLSVQDPLYVVYKGSYIVYPHQHRDSDLHCD